MHKFKGAILIWGNVGVYHLNEIFDSNRLTYFALLCRCTSMSRRTTSTIFIFLSPQFLINHQDTRDVFIECANECTLWVIAMIEAHIHVQHWMSFQEDIRALKAIFFDKTWVSTTSTRSLAAIDWPTLHYFAAAHRWAEEPHQRYSYSSHHSFWLIIKTHRMFSLSVQMSVRFAWLPWMRPIFMCSIECRSEKTFVRSEPKILTCIWQSTASWTFTSIALSATFPTSYICLLSTLLTVNLNIGHCILRGTPIEFRQQEIHMQLVICFSKSQFFAKGLMLIADFLLHNPDLSVVVFCNSWKHSQHFTTHLKKQLDLAKLAINVINIIGSLDKIDKFWQIHLFCDSCHSHQGRFCALVTMNAVNVGIDKHSIALQVCFEWPRDLLTYFQEWGIGSRVEGVQSTCIVYGDLSSYVYLMTQFLSKSINDNDRSPSADDEVIESFNSAISPWRSSRQINTKKTYPLGPTRRRSVRNCTQSEMLDVLQYFCLDLGCQHARGEAYLSTGTLNSHIIDDGACNTLCSICTKNKHEHILPVYHSGVVSLIEYLMQTGKFPHVVDYKSPILSLWAGSPFWKEMLFDRMAWDMSRLQVDALFLSLTVAGIIQLLRNNKSMQWSIKRVYAGSNDGLI